MREAHAHLLADGGGGQLDIFIGKFAVTVGSHLTAVAVIEAHNGFIFPARPQQSGLIDPMRIGQRHAKGGAEGVGAGVIDRAVAGDDRYRPIGEITERDAQVAVDKLIGAIADDNVDTSALFGQRDHPVRAIFVAAGRRGADIIPVRHRRAQRIAGFVIPQIEVFAGIVGRRAAGDAGDIDEMNDSLVGRGLYRFARDGNVR